MANKALKRVKWDPVIFMGMMSAIQRNPVFKAKYNGVGEGRKIQKLVLIACVRKLVVILNAIVRDG